MLYCFTYTQKIKHVNSGEETITKNRGSKTDGRQNARFSKFKILVVLRC